MNIDLKQEHVVKNMDKLKTHIDNLFSQAEDGREEKAVRFKKSYDYYLARLPKAADKKGEQGYVEPVLRKAVDKVLPSLLNIFTENEEQAVIFRPQTSLVPTAIADAVNKYINDCFLRDNDGYKLMTRAFLEALITGDSFVKVYIEENVYEEEFEILDWVPTELLIPKLQEYPDTDTEFPDLEKKVEKLDDQGTVLVQYKGKLDLKRIERKPRIEFVPFNDVYISGSTSDIKDADYICHQHVVSISELLEMGFNKEQVMGLVDTVDTLSNTALSTKKLVNSRVFTNNKGDDNTTISDPLFHKVSLYEHYIRTSLLDKSGKVKLYQVYSAGLDILEINEIERIPFAHGIIEELPGSFWGISLYDKFKASQDMLSELQRAVLTNTKFSLFPAFLTRQGQYDRQSLMNYRPGGVVEVKEQGAVGWFPHIPLPQGVFDSYSKIDASTKDDMMNTVGASFDGQAMGGVSATAVAAAVHSGEMKDKKIAKALAYSLIRPMFELIYNVMRDEGIMLEVEVPTEDGGKATEPLEASALPKRSEFYIDVNTTNDDAQQISQMVNLMNLSISMAQAPSSVITPMNQYKMFKDILKRSDIHNIDEYLSDPTPAEPSQEELAMQQMQQQLQIEQAQLANEMAKANLTLAAISISKAEVEVDEMVKNGAADRLRDKEKSIIEFQKLEVKKEELAMEAEIEATQGRPVSLK